jgi:hypothetical protein
VCPPQGSQSPREGVFLNLILGGISMKKIELVFVVALLLGLSFLSVEKASADNITPPMCGVVHCGH